MFLLVRIPVPCQGLHSYQPHPLVPCRFPESWKTQPLFIPSAKADRAFLFSLNGNFSHSLSGNPHRPLPSHRGGCVGFPSAGLLEHLEHSCFAQTQHTLCHYSVFLSLVARHSVPQLFSPSGFLLKDFKNSRSEKKLQTGF